MKLLIALLMLFGTYSAFAVSNEYDLAMKLSMNGKLVASPHVIVKEGEPATITQKNNREEYFIEVVVTESEVQGHKGILMKFVVGSIGSKGEKAVLSRPQILARENSPAKMAVGSKENGPEELSLIVLVKKKI